MVKAGLFIIALLLLTAEAESILVTFLVKVVGLIILAAVAWSVNKDGLYED